MSLIADDSNAGSDRALAHGEGNLRPKERALRDSEERFHRLLEMSTDAIYIQCDGRFALINSAGEKLLGAETPDQLVGKCVLDLVHPDFREPVDRLIRQLYSEKRPFPPFKCKYLRLDGVPVDAELVAMPCAHGDMPAALVLARDITGQRLAEDRIRLLIHAVQSATDIISITDLDDRFTFVNQAFLKAYGYSEEEVISKTPEIVRSPNNPPEILPEILSASRGGGWRGELLNRRKDGSEFPISLSTSKIVDDEGVALGLLGVACDITDRRQALAERKRLQEQLLQAQKMEAIGQLAGGVAHDFNNLLTVIIGYAASMESGAEGPLKETARHIREAGERTAALTAQLLAFSRKQMVQPRVLNLNHVVSDGANMFRRFIGENIQLATNLDPALDSIRADRGQIDQVILNLTINARDAMPQGGRLTIETRNVKLSDRDMHEYMDLKPGEYIELTITDTGNGMDKETLSRIFEPFFTTKDKAKGSGLGLSTVYGIVKQSDGYIKVTSEVGKGSCFKIYLPSAGKDDSPIPGEPASGEAAGGSETILVVEDEPEVRKLACEVLRGVGYNVLEAEDGESALASCAGFMSPIHLLVTDVVMPGMGGRELADQISLRHPETRVLYMSGYTDDNILRDETMRSDAEFLPKPFSPKVLIRKTRAVLDKP